MASVLTSNTNTLTTNQYSGLSTDTAQNLQKQFGRNSVEQIQTTKLIKVLKWFISPISLMLVGSALLSLVIGKLTDFYFILGLYVTNFAVGQWQEYKADNAVAELQSTFRMQTPTLRDQKWQKIASEELVPKDIIALHSGDIVPADIKLLQSTELSIDESSITGESNAVTKQPGDLAYSGTAIATGELIAEVSAIGTHTKFGQALLLAKKSSKETSAIEQDIIKISKFLAGISLLCILILSIGLHFNHAPLLTIITTDLSLLIAGIPVAMPTVITLIMSLGLTELAKKKVAVRRLSSLEDLANINLLLSDKTGTLTHHHIAIAKILPYQSFTEKQVLELASATTDISDTSPISQAIEQLAEKEQVNLPKSTKYIPGDSIRKRTTATTLIHGTPTTVSVGATQVIFTLCQIEPALLQTAQANIDMAAKQGFRTIAVAYKENSETETEMTLAGIILLADQIREDAYSTIKYLTTQGVEVKMVTGDHIRIAQYVANEIGIPKKIVNQTEYASYLENQTDFDQVGGFAEVFPEDKLNIVKQAKHWYKVAVTGDGVNDIPAVSSADVGIAVRNAVNALHNSADLVLLTDGVAVIKDAIIEARKIFVRVFFYSVYRISESFRVILSITILGLWYHSYPLSPIHLLLLALLNDIPIISLAYDKVTALNRPSAINVKQRMLLSLLFGTIGLINSILFFIILHYFQVSSTAIQTAFFLKLTVSGHLLIYVSHTEKRWWQFLPDKKVIFATITTQIIATLLALFGIFVGKLPWQLVIAVWIWAFFWMQASELVKWLREKWSKATLF